MGTTRTSSVLRSEVKKLPPRFLNFFEAEDAASKAKPKEKQLWLQHQRDLIWIQHQIHRNKLKALVKLILDLKMSLAMILIVLIGKSKLNLKNEHLKNAIFPESSAFCVSVFAARTKWI